MSHHSRHSSLRSASPSRTNFNKPGNVLISDTNNNRVIETNERGDIVWFYGLGPTIHSPLSILGVTDAERIGDLTLMVGSGIPSVQSDNRVLLVSKHKEIKWKYGQYGLSGTGHNLLNVPVHATFLPCNRCLTRRHMCSGSSILITDQGNNRIIRVNEHKKIIWEYPGPNTNVSDQLNLPFSAERLENGNYLIADSGNKRAIEVNRHHVVVRIYTAGDTLGSCNFASRLQNGHTLLTDGANGRVVEVNHDNIILWQFEAGATINRAVRLKNENTLISDNGDNRVIVVDNHNVIQYFYGHTDGNSSGYDLMTTQLGLSNPHDAKIIGDYTGLTNPDK